MNRETALVAGIVALAAGAVVLAAAVPGVIASPGRDADPGRVDVEDVVIAPGTVSGSTATLSVTTVLRHRGDRSENLSVRVQAIDLESGLLETEVERAVDPIEGDREVRVPTDVTVEREGGYRIEVVVYDEGRRVEEATKTVRGVGTLQPEYVRTRVEFHRFGGTGELPTIQYSVAEAGEERTTLELSAFLTNRGDDPSEALRLEFVVRQAESNIVAARSVVEVGGIAPGRTATPSTEVTVPAGYNYYLDAILWKDAENNDQGVIVGSARSVANLDPTERISANTTVREVGLEVSDFERGRGEPTPAAATRNRQAVGTQAPGFGPAAALAALLTVGVIAWRRRS